MITVTSVEAQNRFGQLLDSAQREPVVVTRHGRAAAFIVSPQDMDDIMDARARRTRALTEFEAWSQRAHQTATPAAGALTEQDIVNLVRESR
ncbi:MAG: type II toxin-antitoxin system Phd/YefM family antitoxin [Ramlibacter sp.]